MVSNSLDYEFPRFTTLQDAKSSCVLSPKNMEELNSVAADNDIVLFLHSHGCGHCKKTLPVIEEECQKDNSGTKYIECPIEKPHCRELAQHAGVKGVPDTRGIKKGSSVKNPNFLTVGARIPELRNNIAAFNKKGSGRSGGHTQSQQPRTQPQAQAPAPAPPKPYAPRSPTMDNAVIRLLGNTPTVPPLPSVYGNRAQFRAPKYVPMCVPGKNCTQDEFNQGFVDFYTTDYDDPMNYGL